MKIMNPSYEIIEDQLSTLSIHQRIDACAAICYQRPPKPTEEDAEKFCRSMVERGHLTTLEMAVVSLVVPEWSRPIDNNYFKYFKISPHPGTSNLCIVTGSVRAFMEACEESSPVWEYLAWVFPVFFGGVGSRLGSIRFAEPDEIPPDHQHVAVRFVTNRAVSHELVRHRPCSFLQESQRYVNYDKGVPFIEPEWAKKEPMGIGLWQMACQDAENHYMALRALGKSPQQARAVLPNSTKTELICYASIPQWRHMFDLRCAKAADPEMRRIMIPLWEEMKQRWEV